MSAMSVVLSILFATAAAQTTVDPDEYHLGAGDTLEVSVYGEPELSGSFQVNRAGVLEYPLLGALAVSGRTTNEVSALLAERLRDGFLVDPSVTVSLESYQSQPVQVIGAVVRPGMYYLKGSTTILEILSEAGGMKLEGMDEIRLTRKEAGTEAVMSYERLISSGEGNIELRGGDIVFVPERLITIIGQVEKPGDVAFRNGMTVTIGLAAAGGPMSTANLGKVYILRGEERIRVNVRRVISGRIDDIPLQAGDKVLVRESVF
jgi:polysaccharide export outer membrane protein